MMKIVKLIVGPMASNCYIAWDEDTKDAVIIDPGFEDDRIMETVEKHGLKVGKILLTHGHFDHIGGLEKTKAQTGAKVYICLLYTSPEAKTDPRGRKTAGRHLPVRM